MIAHSFFIGLATVLFETAASATFLACWSAADLPYVYIAAAVLNAGCGLAYAQLRKKVRFAALMQGTLWTLLALVVGIRTAHAWTNGALVAFGALVVYRVISSLTDLEYWAVASRMFDIGQARRLFGVVGTGEVVARALGAFSVPLLLHLGSVDNLMLWSAGSLACCVLVLREILRQEPATVSRQPPPDEAGRAASERYIALVIAVALLGTCGKYLVDWAFLQHVARVGTDARELATLLGVVAGVSQTVSLLLRVLVSRRLLARFGIRVGVVILPVAQALCTLLLLAAGHLHAPAAVLAFVVVNQGLYKALKHPIDNAAFKVLYQPLAAAQRLAAQISVEIVFTPIVVLAVGVFMLVFARRDDDVTFGYVLLGIFALWTITALRAGRRYEHMLAEALRPSRAPVRAPLDVDRERLRDELHLEARRCVLLRDPAELAASRARLLDLLSHLYDHDAIHRVAAHLAHPSREKRALARELLDVVLRREDHAVLTCLTTPEDGAPSRSASRA